MSLVSTKAMLEMASQQNYAVPAFNVENMEMMQAAIFAAESMKSPVIIAISESASFYASLDIFFSMANSLAKNASVPVALHLDHAKDKELVLKALKANFTSIMIDGSTKTYKDNIELTKEIVEICKIFNVPVEAELGVIIGKKNDETQTVLLTDPDIAFDFSSKTKCDTLAISIGNKHGLYKGKPNLDFERLKKIRGTVTVPLVLHGSSDIPDNQIRECIKLGISKFNFATELRIAFTQYLEKYFKNSDVSIDPRVYLKEARNVVIDVCIEKIKLLGCDGKA